MLLDDVLARLGTTSEGLTEEEARHRIIVYGKNVLPEGEHRTFWHMLADQFKNFLVILLIFAAGVSALIGFQQGSLSELVDAAAISAIVGMIAIIGIVQEGRAERAVEALRDMAAPQCVVVRSGARVRLAAIDLVPGDVVIVDSGDIVPADSRLLEAVGLRVDESSLTGESQPVEKEAANGLPRDTVLAERVNMLYMHTQAVAGRAKAMVVATGPSTEIGKVAGLLKSLKQKTPLQIELGSVAKQMTYMFLIVVSLLFVLELRGAMIEGRSVLPALILAISLAVAAVPEGLPAVVTVATSLGVQRMARRHAIIRKLTSVEALGSASVICSDKTGTLTKNEMTVRKIFLLDRYVDVSGAGYIVKGGFFMAGSEINPTQDLQLLSLMEASVHCSNASLGVLRGATPSPTGDPTEIALLVAAAKMGIDQDDLAEKSRRRHEIPFSFESKRMTVVHDDIDGSYVASVKGAPDHILPDCTRVQGPEGAMAIDKWSSRLNEVLDEMAGSGLRVLALAQEKLPLGTRLDTLTRPEHGLTLLGFVGMMDPPREEAKEAIDTCKRAGIRVVMITGDDPRTAVAVGKELGLLDEADPKRVMTARELDSLDDESFQDVVEDVAVYARVSPEHKLRIVEALKRRRQVVAVTGDGVNDAPALKAAHIGVAMGLRGTDVAREASTMVLADDNFASIVAAVEEGRTIYANIRKAVFLLLAANLGEVALLAGRSVLIALHPALSVSFPIPLLPIQLLWINLVTDGAPVLSLSADPPPKGIMRDKPRKSDSRILVRRTWAILCVVGFVVAALALALFFERYPGSSMMLTFTAFVVLELALVLGLRLFFGESMFSNKFLALTMLVSVALQIVVVYLPTPSVFCRPPEGFPDALCEPLAFIDWVSVALMGVAIVGSGALLRRAKTRWAGVFHLESESSNAV